MAVAICIYISPFVFILVQELMNVVYKNVLNKISQFSRYSREGDDSIYKTNVSERKKKTITFFLFKTNILLRLLFLKKSNLIICIL